MEELRALPGVGRKTANVILGQRLRPQRRDHRRHPRRPDRTALAADLRHRSRKGGAGPDGAVPAAEVDPALTPAHQPWPRGVHRSPPSLRRMPHRAPSAPARSCPAVARAAEAGHRPLTFIFLTVFLDLLGVGILVPVIPYIVAEFRSDALTVGLLSLTFAAAQFLASPVLGALSDRYGRRSGPPAERDWHRCRLFSLRCSRRPCGCCSWPG